MTRCSMCRKKAKHKAPWGDEYCLEHWEYQPVYKHGLPFSQKIKENIDDQMARVHVSKPSLIIIDGAQGEGKTTLFVHIADYVQGRMIEFEQQLAMGGSDFSKKLRIAFELQLLILGYDESGDFNKRGSLTRLNALLNRVFETFRALGIPIVMMLPSFAVLDNSLFEKGIPRLLLHCQARDKTDTDIKGYSLYRMYYLREKMKKATAPPQVYDWVHPNFYGHSLNLSPRRATELHEYSIGGKLEVLDLAEIHAEGLQTYAQISTKLNRSVRWVQIKMRDLEIKEKKLHKQKKYFSEEVIDILAQHLDGD